MSAYIDRIGSGDDSITREIVKVQDAFFEFLASVEKKDSEQIINGSGRLYYERFFQVGSHSIRFDCYNIAWLSQKSEKPAQLFFPTHIVKPSQQQCDLVIAGLHHPTPWADPNNARELRDLLETTADMVFTGHEHVSDGNRKERSFLGTVTHFVEAPALQASDTDEVGFNLVEMDLAEDEHRTLFYKWSEDKYTLAKESEPTKTRSGHKAGRKLFRNNDHWNKLLSDPGAPFSHRYKTSPLTLQDIYVYPEMNLQMSEERPEVALLDIIRSRDVLRFILDSPSLIVTGETFSGKTSLWKAVYPEFQREEKVPVLIEGADIKSTSPDKLLKLIHKNFNEQYSSGLLESYKQLDIPQRVLIIEDFHLCPLTTSNKIAVLHHLQNLCGHLLILANPIFLFEEVAAEKEMRELLLNSPRASIKEFGHALRDQLINKWYRLGRENTAMEEEIQHECRQAGSFIKTIRETACVSSYPFFVLTMLQTFEAGQTLKTSGEYGYFYEHLIIQRLSVGITARINMDLLQNYIPYPAAHLYNNKKETLSAEEFEQITKQYSQDYSLGIHLEQMKNILTKSLILQDDRNGGYRFAYKYTYYYFTARYLKNNIDRSQERKAIRRQLAQMVRQIHAEDNANIILFFLYLTRDEETIQRLLKQAKKLYQDQPLCDLDKQTPFLNSMEITPPEPALPEVSLQEHRAQRLERLDEIEDHISTSMAEAEKISPEEKRALDEIIQLNTALKTIQILGQVLRNFPGSLPGMQKEKLAEECYLLGLRTMSLILDMFEAVGADLRSILMASLKSDKEDISQEKLARRTEEMFFLLTLGMTSFGIRHISNSVGAEILKETYKAVEGKYSDNLAVKFVDLVIKLDFFQSFPENEIFRIEALTRKNPFALNLLRGFVIEHFSMNPRPYKLKQKVCEQLQIRHNLPKLLQAKN